MLEMDKYTLGGTNTELVFGSREDVRAITLALTQQCQRTLDIMGRGLDPDLYESPPFLDAVRKLIARSSHSRIRLLVLQPEALYRRGHALIALAGAFSSFCHVRVPGPDHQDLNEAMLVADETGYLHRKLSDRYEGTANFNNRPYVGGLMRRFEEVWMTAEADPNFQRLRI
ncbi:MAG TPA: hypothetical protein VMH34_00985 [Gammaproteobacteria bacterium]|nr:hypothetical protein [Gammaproteobacteria bacterium]